MNIPLISSWEKALSSEIKAEYYQDLLLFLETEYNNHVVYPAEKNIFAALNATPLDEVKVVILGQDPYHGPNQANGLSFSVNQGVKIPPSLRNIYKEITASTGVVLPPSGDLTPWGNQGVLLLNATLTVRANEAGSHQKKGWERFTDAVIEVVNANKHQVVYLLWGSFAQKKASFVNDENNLILKAPHPSPLSAHRGFFGCNHFSLCNAYLEKNGKNKIDWQPKTSTFPATLF